MNISRLLLALLLIVPAAHSASFMSKNDTNLQQGQSHHNKAEYQALMFTNNAADMSAMAVKNSHQAGKIVKQIYGGKVLKVSKSGSQSTISYVVKLLKTDGKIITVAVDAASGRVSRR